MRRKTVRAHHDPDPVHYMLTKGELDSLKERCRIPEKENTFFLIGLLLPSALTVTHDVLSQDAFSVLSFVNLFIVVSCLVAGMLQARGWYDKRNALEEFLDEMEAKPQVAFTVTDKSLYTNAGGTPSSPAALTSNS